MNDKCATAQLRDLLNAAEEYTNLALMKLLCQLLDQRDDLSDEQKDAILAQFCEAILCPKSERPAPPPPPAPDADQLGEPTE